MSRKAALIIAGAITTLAMIVVLGVGTIGGRLAQPVAAAGAADAAAATATGACVNPADVAALQAQLADYQAALQQANNQLQAAYDQLAGIQSQGRFSDEHEDDDRGGGFFLPFGGG